MINNASIKKTKTKIRMHVAEKLFEFLKENICISKDEEQHYTKCIKNLQKLSSFVCGSESESESDLSNGHRSFNKEYGKYCQNILKIISNKFSYGTRWNSTLDEIFHLALTTSGETEANSVKKTLDKKFAQLAIEIKPIFSIPLEISIKISNYLEDKDRAILRLVCKKFRVEIPEIKDREARNLKFLDSKRRARKARNLKLLDSKRRAREAQIKFLESKNRTFVSQLNPIGSFEIGLIGESTPTDYIFNKLLNKPVPSFCDKSYYSYFVNRYSVKLQRKTQNRDRFSRVTVSHSKGKAIIVIAISQNDKLSYWLNDVNNYYICPKHIIIYCPSSETSEQQQQSEAKQISNLAASFKLIFINAATLSGDELKLSLLYACLSHDKNNIKNRIEVFLQEISEFKQSTSVLSKFNLFNEQNKINKIIQNLHSNVNKALNSSNINFFDLCNEISEHFNIAHEAAQKVDPNCEFTSKLGDLIQSLNDIIPTQSVRLISNYSI